MHRVSIRAADDFIGWLTAYLLVPEVFGSAGGGRNHQTERFDGADCADVMVGALPATFATTRRATGTTSPPCTRTRAIRPARTTAGPMASSSFDIVIHMGHPHLVIEPLANQAPATVDVLRWR